MRKALILIALLSAGLAVLFEISTGSLLDSEYQNLSAFPSASKEANPVVEWNRILLGIVRTPGAQAPTVHPTRSFAMMHAAIYDAVNAIDRRYQPYLVHLENASPGASQEAAANAAAHDVLVALYPKTRATLDTEFQRLQAQTPYGEDKTAGLDLGQTVAARILALRENDGSSAQPVPYIFGDTPGDYQAPPPSPAGQQPQFTHWSRVTPFALNRGDQFRPGPPPSLTSNAYTQALNEIRVRGIANSTASSPEQALTGRFWNGAIQNYWNEIAQTAVLANRSTTAQSARVFALLNLAIADEVIAFYDAKYRYNFWRPVTAIRAPSTDITSYSAADPKWLPEVQKTTPDPAYPGAHAVISAGAAAVLTSMFGSDQFAFSITSEVLPGVERSFTSFAAAAEEATLSRIYAGVHFRTDLTAGQELGRQIASFVINKFMAPLNATDGYDDGQSTSELKPHASSTRRAKYRSNQKVNLPSVSPIQGKGVPTQERKRSSEAV